MRDFDNLWMRFRQFGGWRLVRRYARMGVLWLGLCEIVKCAFSRRSFKSVYPAITAGVDEALLKQYRGCFLVPEKHDAAEKPKIAWVIWLQGIDDAPQMVKVCMQSQQKHLADYEYRYVTEDNYRQWITLPPYIEWKRRKGYIPAACFSDLIRIELLVNYGGLYMDASVLCTGFEHERLKKRWAEIEKSELFFFRYFRRKEAVACGLSNWFFSVKPHSAVLTMVRDALFAYWNDYDCVVDYYIFHLFLGKACQLFPENVASMPRGNSFHCTMLGGALANDYDEEAWQDLIAHVSFHKLNFRKADEAARNPHSYYNRIFKVGFINYHHK